MSDEQASVQQRPITHVGLTVPDLDAALAWYRNVLGYEELTPAGEIRCGEGNFGEITADIWGQDWTVVRMAHIGSDRGGVIEVFEYPDFEQPEGYEYKRLGWSHICVVDADLDALVEQVKSEGGKQRSKIWPMFEGQPFRMVYLEDPWGTVIEAYSHSHEETYQLGRTTDSAQR